MKKSEPCDQLYTALAAARANFGVASRTKTANITSVKGSYAYSYAPLEECFHAIDKALGDQGLALVGGVEYGEDGRLWVITHLGHTSGQWIENALDCGVPKDIKEMGGMLTYARRYGVTLTVQMHAEDDDDGPRGDGGTLDRRTARKAQPKAAESPKPPADERGGPDRAVSAPAGKPTEGEFIQLMQLLHGTYTHADAVESQVRAILKMPGPVPYEERRIKMLMTREAYTRLYDEATAYARIHATPEDDVPLTTGPESSPMPQEETSVEGEGIDSHEAAAAPLEADSHNEASVVRHATVEQLDDLEALAMTISPEAYAEVTLMRSRHQHVAYELYVETREQLLLLQSQMAKSAGGAKTGTSHSTPF